MALYLGSGPSQHQRGPGLLFRGAGRAQRTGLQGGSRLLSLLRQPASGNLLVCWQKPCGHRDVPNLCSSCGQALPQRARRAHSAPRGRKCEAMRQSAWSRGGEHGGPPWVSEHSILPISPFAFRTTLKSSLRPARPPAILPWPRPIHPDIRPCTEVHRKQGAGSRGEQPAQGLRHGAISSWGGFCCPSQHSHGLAGQSREDTTRPSASLSASAFGLEATCRPDPCPAAWASPGPLHESWGMNEWHREVGICTPA